MFRSKKIMKKLTNGDICYLGLLVKVEKDPKKEYIKLKTEIFSEKDYIPLSIRECVEKMVNKVFLKKNSFFSYLEIDEKTFSINYVQIIPYIEKKPFFNIIKLFIFAARSWALVLKRIASQDLLKNF